MKDEAIIKTFSNLQNDVRTHSVRTGIYARIIAESTENFCNKYQEAELPQIMSAVMDGGLYHDIGKVFISKKLLQKRINISPEELEIIRQHPLMTERILLTEKDFTGQNDEYKKIVINMGKYHHEHYDGSGYPTGRGGEEIPIEARICAVANIFDAIMFNREYKKAYREERAIEMIKKSANTILDPYIINCFVAALPRIKSTAHFIRKPTVNYVNEHKVIIPR